MKTKICSICNITKELSEFYKRKTKDGYSSFCIKCKREYNNNYNKKNKEKIAIRSKKYREKNKKIQRINSIKKAMIQRCEDIKFKGYKYYGGKGITVCKEWHDVKIFKTWALSNGYQDNLTIDRIDEKKGYYPENCQWITQHEQILKQERNKGRAKEDLYIYEQNSGAFSVEIASGTKHRRVIHLRVTAYTKEEAIIYRDHFLKTGEKLEYKSDYIHKLSNKKKEYLRKKKRREMFFKHHLTKN